MLKDVKGYQFAYESKTTLESVNSFVCVFLFKFETAHQCFIKRYLYSFHHSGRRVFACPSYGAYYQMSV